MKNRVFGNQGKKMFKNEFFGDNGDELRKKMISNIKYTRFFFLLGIWFAFFALLFVSSLVMALIINNLTFLTNDFTISVLDILSVYCIFIIALITIKLFPLK